MSILMFVIAAVFSFKTSSYEIESEDYYPKNAIKFETHHVKTKKNEKIVLRVTGGEKDNIKYSISDATKIKIVSSTHQGIIFERISDYLDEEYICVYNKTYEELRDICYVSCYNEILSCEDVYLYQKNLNEDNVNSQIPLGNGEYFLEFKINKINNNYLIEDESLLEIKSNIEEFFKVSIDVTSPRRLDICFKINVDTKKVFTYEIRKTMSFKVDRGIFIYTFQKGI